MAIPALRRAFVLHRRDYRNTSLLVEFLCAEEGRLVAVAKGAKAAASGRSAQAALLQPFQPLWIAWTGRGQVKTLTRAEAADQALPLTGKRLYCGFYLNELLLRLIERHDPQDALFVFYQQALADLVAGELEPVLRRFELRLLEELGYAPDLTKDSSGAPIAAEQHYRHVPEVGLVRVVTPEAGSMRSPAGGHDAQDSAELESPVPLITGRAVAGLAAGESLLPVDARAARALMRAALAPLLGPKPLKSRDLFRRLASPPKT